VTPQSDNRVSTSLGNSGLCWTVFARNRDTAVPAEGNGDLQTLICVLMVRPRRCLTLSNPVPWQNWMAASLGYTLRMKTLFHGWPIMVHDTHMRRKIILLKLCVHCQVESDFDETWSECRKCKGLQSYRADFEYLHKLCELGQRAQTWRPGSFSVKILFICHVGNLLSSCKYVNFFVINCFRYLCCVDLFQSAQDIFWYANTQADKTDRTWAWKNCLS